MRIAAKTLPLLLLGALACSPLLAAKQEKEKAPPPPSVEEQLTARCNEDVAGACRNLAIRLEKGQDMPLDKAKALAMYEKACTLSDFGACSMAGNMYDKGADGVTADKAKAFEYYLKACGGQDAIGCLDSGVAYYNGDGVKRNVTKAVDLFKQACDLKNDQGCDYYNKIMGP